jgi:hypothetical protein
MGGKKHYNNKFINNVINVLKQNGFICEPLKKSKNKYCISRNGGENICVHAGMSCYHPLRRFLKSTYNFDIENY